MEKNIKILKALSDETRYKIVSFLIPGEKCVCEIIPHTKRKQSTVSIHLGKLEKAGVVKSRKDGKKVFYSLSNQKVRTIFKLLKSENNF